MSARHDDYKVDWRLPRASEDAFTTSPCVARLLRRAYLRGFVTAMAVYGIGSVVLILAFRALGVH